MKSLNYSLHNIISFIATHYYDFTPVTIDSHDNFPHILRIKKTNNKVMATTKSE